MQKSPAEEAVKGNMVLVIGGRWRDFCASLWDRRWRETDSFLFAWGLRNPCSFYLPSGLFFQNFNFSFTFFWGGGGLRVPSTFAALRILQQGNADVVYSFTWVPLDPQTCVWKTCISPHVTICSILIESYSYSWNLITARDVIIPNAWCAPKHTDYYLNLKLLIDIFTFLYYKSQGILTVLLSLLASFTSLFLCFFPITLAPSPNAAGSCF